MSELSDRVLEASDVGCCVTRMGACHCHNHVDETARLIGQELRQILESAASGNAGPRLVAYIKQLETT